MSFVTLTRDYVEFLNNLSNTFNGIIPVSEVLKESLFYFSKTIQYCLVYLFSFQWLRDFTLLPIIVPQLSTALLKEKLFLDTSSNLFLNFLELPGFTQNSLILGFTNSLSLTFPISVIHIITIRRFYIKGIPAAVFSIAGYLLGQILFITCVISGLRNVIIPWFTLEPLNYIIGFILIFRLIYAMTQENLRELNGWAHPQYKNFFLVSFLLAWCEQSSIFQYLGNLSLNSTSSILELNPSETTLNISVDHSLYILGLVFGSIIFTVLWGFFFLQLKNIFVRYTPFFLTNFIQTINKASFIIAIAFSLSSIPFYGFDYLATGPLGFVSRDRVFKNSIFDQYNLKDSVHGLGISSGFSSVDIDVSPFDRGRYVIFPEKAMPFDFEDLNYRGEAEWTTRFDKVSTLVNRKAGFLSLAKFLKKPKSDEVVTQQPEINKKILPIKSNFNIDISDIPTFADLNTKESRFNDWYNIDPTLLTDGRGNPLEGIFVESQDTSFPLDFSRTKSVERKNIDLKIKQKYYSNPMYKNLLELEMDLFLNRQPKEFRLSPQQEVDLYTKRRVLTSYYDSLRDYAKLPYMTVFENFFDGTKSFSNKVYNQQFKGTLRSVCRLFSLTVDQEANLNKNELVLKYDQPLYLLGKNSSFLATHEELNKVDDWPKEKPKNVQEIPSGPLYAGWDDQIRKFVITNKFLPRRLAGTKINLTPELQPQFVKQSLSLNEEENYKIKFTSWPIHSKILNQGKSNSVFSFRTLYTPAADFGPIGDPEFQNLAALPGNWETRNRRINLGETYDNIFDYLAPQRGGFIWPGNKNFIGKINP